MAQLCCWLLLFGPVLVLLGPTPIHAMVPAPPVRCSQTGCTLYNSYGVWNDRKDCHVPSITYPRTEEELRLAVAHANQNKLKLKVVTKFSHTIPKLACPDANSENAMLISTENYSSSIEIDRANLAVTADSGVGLRQLIDKVEESGLSLAAAPYWEGVSVGGVISTGAHGSSWWGKGGAVHDHVTELSLVVPAKESDGFAKIIRISPQDPIFNAAKVSLGLLGIISKVKFSLDPGFKRSVTFNFTDDVGIEDKFLDHGKKYEFGDITWYPSRHTAVYRNDDRVPLNVSGNGVNDFIGFQSNLILISQATRSAEKSLEKSGNVMGKCMMASTFLGTKKLVANGFKNGLIFTGYPVVGRQGKMQTSGSCLYSTSTATSCSWDPRINGLFFYETTAIFPASKFGDFIRDVKKLRDIKPENFCGIDIYNGLLIRFIKASQAYLGQSEDSVVVDFNYYRASDASVPRLNQDLMEEIEQIAFFKYGAKPHCCWLLLFGPVLVLLGPTPIHAMVPAPPVRCSQTGCTLYNSYGVWNDRKDCHVPSITYPRTEEELRLAVAHANQNKLKLKVVTKFSHTIPKLACPDANSENAMLISTENYSSSIEIDRANLAVTADSGVGLRQLIDKVEESGLSLAAAPYWEGVSVGGVISTGAHGSSWWGKGGAVHDHVTELSLVVPAKESDGFAKIIRISPQDPIFNAAKVSLGLLGIISKVKFSLDPGFKRSVTFNFTDDVGIEDKFLDHGKKYEFGDITWYPSRHTAVYRNDDRVPLNVSGNGVNDFIGFQSNLILISQATRSAEKSLEKSGNVMGKCMMASTFLGTKKLVANGFKNGLIFTGYPVVGRQGKMQTSGSCLYSTSTATSCSWDPRINGLFFYETTAIFPASKFGDFIRDVKKLRDIKPENFCGIDIYNGLLIRFIKASQAYLGQSEDSVVVDFNYYRASDASVPRLNQDLMEEIEQIAFFKYGAKPHWAKNRNSAFLNVQEKYGNFNKFLMAKKRLDPTNMFSSEWSDEILFGKGGGKGEGCSLEGECICSDDSHCSPQNGYLCQQGLVYKEARVCRHSSTSFT